MRRAGRIDSNQTEIVDALRRVGCEVEITSMLGGGFPDLLVRPRGRMPSLLQMELKRPGGKLRPEQIKYLSRFPETLVIDTVEDALRAVGVRM